MSKLIKYKNKEELDLLSYDEIMTYRIYILRNDITDWKCYVEELELYVDIRFKETVIDRFDSYREKLKNPNIDSYDKSAMSLILSLQPDTEKLYKFFTDGKFKSLQPFKYIELVLN